MSPSLAELNVSIGDLVRTKPEEELRASVPKRPGVLGRLRDAFDWQFNIPPADTRLKVRAIPEGKNYIWLERPAFATTYPVDINSNYFIQTNTRREDSIPVVVVLVDSSKK